MNILQRSLTLAAMLMVAACGSRVGDSSTPQKLENVSMNMAATAKGAAVGAAVYVSDTTVASLTPIADNFATTNGLQPAWGDGHLPSSMGIDPVGAFRLICSAGQIAYDDPLVYPGQPGKSHLHQFYGNVTANANSTYQSLRTAGGSTCGDPNLPEAVNRSGYWMPAMLDGAGNVVKPMYVAIYYKRIPKYDRRCTRSNPGSIGDCVGIPTGLRFITGYNMEGGTSDTHPFFYCQDSATVKAFDGSLKDNMNQVVPLCPVGARLTLNIDGPDCWDGINLDSADHRSHVSHSTYVWDPTVSAADGGPSYQRCDDAHPYHMPKVSIIAIYSVDANFAAGKWHLASDEMVPGAPAGTTFHADYVEAWSPVVRDGWLKNCIDAHLSCQGGELGDGTQIRGMTVPPASSQLIALSSIATPTTALAAETTTSTVPVVTSPVVLPTTTIASTTTQTGTTTTTASGTTSVPTTTTGTATTSTGTTGTTTTTISGKGGLTCTGKGRARKCSG